MRDAAYSTKVKDIGKLKYVQLGSHKWE